MDNQTFNAINTILSSGVLDEIIHHVEAQSTNHEEIQHENGEIIYRVEIQPNRHEEVQQIEHEEIEHEEVQPNTHEEVQPLRIEIHVVDDSLFSNGLNSNSDIEEISNHIRTEEERLHHHAEEFTSNERTIILKQVKFMKSRICNIQYIKFIEFNLSKYVTMIYDRRNKYVNYSNRQYNLNLHDKHFILHIYKHLIKFMRNPKYSLIMREKIYTYYLTTLDNSYILNKIAIIIMFLIIGFDSFIKYSCDKKYYVKNIDEIISIVFNLEGPLFFTKKSIYTYYTMQDFAIFMNKLLSSCMIDCKTNAQANTIRLFSINCVQC